MDFQILYASGIEVKDADEAIKGLLEHNDKVFAMDDELVASLEREGERIVLQDIQIEPGIRGNGVATALIHELERGCQARSVEFCIRLHAPPIIPLDTY